MIYYLPITDLQSQQKRATPNIWLCAIKMKIRPTHTTLARQVGVGFDVEFSLKCALHMLPLVPYHSTLVMITVIYFRLIIWKGGLDLLSDVGQTGSTSFALCNNNVCFVSSITFGKKMISDFAFFFTFFFIFAFLYFTVSTWTILLNISVTHCLFNLNTCMFKIRINKGDVNKYHFINNIVNNMLMVTCD